MNLLEKHYAACTREIARELAGGRRRVSEESRRGAGCVLAARPRRPRDRPSVPVRARAGARKDAEELNGQKKSRSVTSRIQRPARPPGPPSDSFAPPSLMGVLVWRPPRAAIGFAVWPGFVRFGHFLGIWLRRFWQAPAACLPAPESCAGWRAAWVFAFAAPARPAACAAAALRVQALCWWLPVVHLERGAPRGPLPHSSAGRRRRSSDGWQFAWFVCFIFRETRSRNGQSKRLPVEERLCYSMGDRSLVYSVLSATGNAAAAVQAEFV
ncbi:unnamed protein product [Amoebophrya sp. A120]|nr:unnamed protein product [Amoebophrya sp. A120]|eukprot:GSA120T00022468001.1